MKKIILVSLLLISYVGHSQNSGIGINPTGVNPDPSAGLDIDFTDKGVLIPRLTTIQRDGIQNPAIGLQIYNTTTDCLQLYTPLSGWHDVVCDCQMPPTASAFTFTDSLSNNSNVVFTATTAGLSYSWTFQNGTPSTSNLQSDTVTWAVPGIYAVTLTVTDNVGCMSSTTDSVTVVACPPPLAVSFTNCSQTGRTGPSQGQCNSAYTGTPLANNVTVTNGIQQWTVPSTGNYLIEVAGARSSASSNGGNGAKIEAIIPLTQGQQLDILVGQEGMVSTGNYRSGGGGGTFVISNSNPLIVAGGAGGGGSSSGGSYNPSITTNGSTSTGGISGLGGGGIGGVNGNGGGAAGSSSWAGGGGGGYLTNGVTYSSNGYGGLAYVNGGAGGNSSTAGGFGGGGGNGIYSGGGGGGYSGGGGGGSDPYAGGGGGSYIDASATNVSTSDGQYNNSSTFNGSSITNLNAYNLGHGYVNITLVCP